MSNLYSLIKQRPINPHEVFKKISYDDIANSLSLLIKNNYEELKANDILYNNFTSLASTTILIAQNQKKNEKNERTKVEEILTNDFVNKFNNLVHERYTSSDSSS